MRIRKALWKHSGLPRSDRLQGVFNVHYHSRFEGQQSSAEVNEAAGVFSSGRQIPFIILIPVVSLKKRYSFSVGYFYL